MEKWDAIWAYPQFDDSGLDSKLKFFSCWFFNLKTAAKQWIFSLLFNFLFRFFFSSATAIAMYYFDLLNSQLRNRTEGSFSGPIFLSDYKYFDKLNPWMSWFHKIENWISKWINTISVWSVFNGILVSTWHHSWCWLAHAQRLSNSSLNIFDNQDVNNEKVNFTKIRRLKRLKTNWILGEISSKLKPSIWRENVL